MLFDPSVGLLESGFPQPVRHHNYAVPNGLYTYWGLGIDCLDIGNNLAFNLAGEDRTIIAPILINSPASGTNTAGYTVICAPALQNSFSVASIGVYRTTAQTFNVKIVSGAPPSATFTVVVSESFSHGGTGWEDHILASPYLVPASGNYYIGVYSAATMNECSGNVTRAYISGDATGTQTTWTNDFGPAQGLRYTGSIMPTKNGILHNFTSSSVVNGVIGQALKFNGSSNYIDVTVSSPLSSDSQSLSFWMPDKGTNKTAYLFARNPSIDQYPPSFGLLYNAGNFRLTQGGEAAISTWAALNNGDHICFVCNYPSWICYQNGKILNSGTTSTHFNLNPEYATSIGRAGGYNNYYFDGSMCDVRVYNRALDQGEVVTLHGAGLAGRRNALINQALAFPTLFPEAAPSFIAAWAAQSNNPIIGAGTY